MCHQELFCCGDFNVVFCDDKFKGDPYACPKFIGGDIDLRGIWCSNCRTKMVKWHNTIIKLRKKIAYRQEIISHAENDFILAQLEGRFEDVKSQKYQTIWDHHRAAINMDRHAIDKLLECILDNKDALDDETRSWVIREKATESNKLVGSEAIAEDSSSSDAPTPWELINLEEEE